MIVCYISLSLTDRVYILSSGDQHLSRCSYVVYIELVKACLSILRLIAYML